MLTVDELRNQIGQELESQPQKAEVVLAHLAVIQSGLEALSRLGFCFELVTRESAIEVRNPWPAWAHHRQRPGLSQVVESPEELSALGPDWGLEPFASKEEDLLEKLPQDRPVPPIVSFHFSP